MLDRIVAVIEITANPVIVFHSEPIHIPPPIHSMYVTGKELPWIMSGSWPIIVVGARKVRSSIGKNMFIECHKTSRTIIDTTLLGITMLSETPTVVNIIKASATYRIADINPYVSYPLLLILSVTPVRAVAIIN